MRLLTVILFFTFSSFIVKAQPSFVKLTTNKGDITLMLYEETPKHRDAFLETIKTGFYNEAQFNRVIKSFVSQAGELDDPILDREKLHPETPIRRIPAEFSETLFHKKGALGAGRNDNPDKSDYYTQIYLVAGKVYTDAQLDLLEQKKGRKYPLAQREIYKTIGGTPDLDQDYNIFGEIVNGLEVADAINAVPTDKTDLPLTAVKFKAEILNKKDAAKLWKKISKESTVSLPVHK
jgi:cyclophilin family peptidyl-prolyl cis-trans isomerase